MAEKKNEEQEEERKSVGPNRENEIKAGTDLSDVEPPSEPLPLPEGTSAAMVRPLGAAKSLAFGLPYESAIIEDAVQSNESTVASQMQAGVIPVEGDDGPIYAPGSPLGTGDKHEQVTTGEPELGTPTAREVTREEAREEAERENERRNRKDKK